MTNPATHAITARRTRALGLLPIERTLSGSRGRGIPKIRRSSDGEEPGLLDAFRVFLGPRLALELLFAPLGRRRTLARIARPCRYGVGRAQGGRDGISNEVAGRVR